MPLSVPAFSPPALRGTDLPLQGLTLLAVEDSRLTCEVLRLMCQRSGARLRRADGLAAARVHLRRYRPDVVLIDLGLPDGRGEDLMADLAARPGHPPIIGMSGMGHDGLPAGADAFLHKPLPGLAMLSAPCGRGAPLCLQWAKPPGRRQLIRWPCKMICGRPPGCWTSGMAGLWRNLCWVWPAAPKIPPWPLPRQIWRRGGGVWPGCGR
ncbi:MAG: response regulator [Gemmobacter sp.]|nr:response regulator [Gemmobacter sp.]